MALSERSFRILSFDQIEAGAGRECDECGRHAPLEARTAAWSLLLLLSRTHKRGDNVVYLWAARRR
jgi:hypothetical protein